MGVKQTIKAVLLCSLGILPIRHTAWDATHIAGALSVLYHRYPQEEIALITDRERYDPGETIWFSAYLNCLGKPSEVSKVLYVEVIDSTGHILHRLILPVDAGTTEGSFRIPDEYPAGRYQLRAYTSWMLNFDRALLFRKEIDIGELAVARADTAGEYVFDWFPEGGRLVGGLTSRLAFRAGTVDGRPVSVTGMLFDSSAKPIRTFGTLHDGLGSFVIHPSPGNHYTAVVEFPGGRRRKVPLPKIEPSGVVIYVNQFLAADGEDSVYFRISRSIADKEKYQHLVLCAEMQGKVDFTYINFDNDFAGNYNNSVLTAPSPLSLDGFPPGVLHLTVFDDKEEVLAQRLVYLQQNASAAAPVLSRADSAAAPQGKNRFRLEIPGDAAGLYTVSVTRLNGTGGVPDSPPNIRSTLLLAADIHSPVNDWAWYCRDTKKETLQALDLLMLTSNWVRFDWDKILHDDYPPIRYYAEQSLMLKGKAVWGAGKRGKAIRNGEFALMVKAPQDSLFDLINVPVDSDGRFSLVNLSFHDTAYLYVQNKNQKKDREVTVLFDRDPLDTILTAPPLYPFAGVVSDGPRPDSAERRQIPADASVLAGRHKEKDTTVLGAALVRGRRKTRTDSLLENYATGMFANPGAWARTMDFTDDRWTESRYDIDVVDYLRGKVAGLQWSSTVSGGTTIPLVAWRFTNGLFVSTNQTTLFEMNAPSFFLDEQMLNEGSGNYESAMEILLGIPMAQVAMIRIFQPGSFAGISGMAPHGVIAIYTKNGTEGRLKYIPSAFSKITRTGYAVQRQFSPDRETLYWNPSLVPDSATHYASFGFDDAEGSGPYRITIQGVDRNGRVVFIDSVFAKK